MRFGKTSLRLLSCVSACALALAGCAQPDQNASRTPSPADSVPTNVNITCARFTSLSTADQKTAADKLLRSYHEASALASDQAKARRDFHLEGKLSDRVEMESPSFLNLARHTCALPRNRDAVGYSPPWGSASLRAHRCPGSCPTSTGAPPTVSIQSG